MIIEAKTVTDYLHQVPENYKSAFITLRDTLKTNLPDGFEEVIIYNMIGFVVPKTLYPKGYHVNPELPLPFISIAIQKHFIALYHMGLYADADLLDWFKAEYPKHSKHKLDMGKSCLRFKNPDNIPYSLIGELASKVSPRDWVKTYEDMLRK